MQRKIDTAIERPYSNKIKYNKKIEEKDNKGI